MSSGNGLWKWSISWFSFWYRVSFPRLSSEINWIVSKFDWLSSHLYYISLKCTVSQFFFYESPTHLYPYDFYWLPILNIACIMSILNDWMIEKSATRIFIFNCSFYEDHDWSFIVTGGLIMHYCWEYPELIFTLTPHSQSVNYAKKTTTRELQYRNSYLLSRSFIRKVWYHL